MHVCLRVFVYLCVFVCVRVCVCVRMRASVCLSVCFCVSVCVKSLGLTALILVAQSAMKVLSGRNIRHQITNQCLSHCIRYTSLCLKRTGENKLNIPGRQDLEGYNSHQANHVKLYSELV